jgi:hypothetical protein
VIAVHFDNFAGIRSVRAFLHRVGAIMWRRLALYVSRYQEPSRIPRLLRIVGLCGMGVALLVADWHPSIAEPLGRYGPPAVPVQDTGATSSLHQRQVEFLHRLRQSDRRYETIDKAVFNARNELGVVLDRRVEMDAIRPLLRTILTQMARTFPGNDLVVIAYAPTQPPREIGTARLRARTREMTYTPAVPINP